MAAKIWTYIRLSGEMAKALRELGNKGDTYDDIIRRLVGGVDPPEEPCDTPA